MKSVHFCQRRCRMNASILSGQEALRLELSDIHGESRRAVAWITAHDVPCKRVHRRTLLLPSGLLQQDGVIGEARGQIRVIASERFFLNRDRTAVERLR